LKLSEKKGVVDVIKGRKWYASPELLAQLKSSLSKTVLKDEWFHMKITFFQSGTGELRVQGRVEF